MFGLLTRRGDVQSGRELLSVGRLLLLLDQSESVRGGTLSSWIVADIYVTETNERVLFFWDEVWICKG